MKKARFSMLAAVAALCFAAAAPGARAQVSVGVQIGPPPECPYGYFDYAPYNCAPFGYYGPQWFSNGLFIGAGPWYRGPRDFDGWVNRHYDPRYGYRGELPRRGEHPDWDRHRGWEQHFHGDHERHIAARENGNPYGQNGDHRDNRDRNGQYNGRDNGNRNGQYGQHQENGNRNGQYENRRDNGNRNGQYGEHQDNGNRNGQSQERRDNGSQNGQYNNREDHGNSHGNGHDNSRDNGQTRGHDDNGH